MSPVIVFSRRVLLTLLVACALCWLAPPSAVLGGEKATQPVLEYITLTWSVSPEDPFSKENAVGVTPQFKRGETFYLTITGKLKEGYHTYPLTKKTEQQKGGVSTLTYEKSNNFTPLWPIEESEPEAFNEGPDFGVNWEHVKPFTWTQEILVKSTATPGVDKLMLHLHLQVCNEHTCTPGNLDLEILVTIAQGSEVALTPAIEKKLKNNKPPEPEVVEPQFNEIKEHPPEAVRAAPADNGSRTTKPNDANTSPPPNAQPAIQPVGFVPVLLDSLVFIGLAALAGIVSLFTPCVFPMIPITVSFFIHKSEAQKSSPLRMAAIYSGTIVVVLTVGGLLLMTSLQQISQHWATNLILGLLFIGFALSLFGMYEITLPSFLVNASSKRQDQGGALGTVFMALTFTLVSFTCVAPFYGGFAATVASAQSVGVYVKLFFAALAYSVTFALPFFVLALFPGLLRTLPKSGGWMNTIKVMMGFLELAAAFGFLRGAEMVWTNAQPRVLTFDVVLGIYVALSLTCGLYLLNLFRLPHDYEAKPILSVPRLLFALLFLALGLYLAPALFKQPNGTAQRPNGVVFEWIQSFLLADPSPPMETAGATNEPANRPLVWLGNLQDGLEQAKKDKKRVFIDFTGVTCKNCNFNENTVFTLPEVRALMGQYVLVQLYCDSIPYHVKNSRSADENFKFEYDAFQSVQRPLYVIVEPSDDSFATLEKYDEGKINNVNGFKAFMRKYLPSK